MKTFESRVKQPPYTMYDNELIQKETIFKNANQKLAYMFLHSYANAHKIFPSMDSIADAICATPRTAIKIVQELEEMTFIEVKREAGKSNNYILNDYFEVVENLTRAKSSLLKQSRTKTKETEDMQDQRTREKIAPVQDVHGTRENITRVEPVKNFHPITKTIFSKNKKEKLVRLASSDENILSFDLIQKEAYPEVPYEEIKAKLFEDANADKVVMNTFAQYQALIMKRISFYLEAQPEQPEIAQIDEVKPESNQDSLKEQSRKFKAILSESEPIEETTESDRSQSEKQAEIERMLKQLEESRNNKNRHN